MFTKQASTLANSLASSGMPAQQASSVQNMVGQCQAPLTHRGPVKIDYTRPYMREINQGFIPPPGMSPFSFPSLGPEPQNFPPYEGDIPPDSLGPPEEDGNTLGDPPPAGTPPEESFPPPPYGWPDGQGNAVWLTGGDIKVEQKIFNGLSIFNLNFSDDLRFRTRQFVTDVFIDGDNIVVEKRKYRAFTLGSTLPTNTTLATFKEQDRVTDVYSTGSSLLKDTKTVKVLVKFPADGETEETNTIIDLLDC